MAECKMLDTLSIVSILQRKLSYYFWRVTVTNSPHQK